MKLRLSFVPLLGLLSACGGNGSPTGPSMPPPTPVNGTVLTFVSGDLDVGITGATINVAGQPPRTTDANGQVLFGQVLPASLPYDAVASGYLPRNSMIRSLTDTRLSLVPVRPGFDESFIQQMMFHEFVPGRRLSRPAQNLVYLRLSPEIAGDDQAKQVHEQAARIATDATQQKISFVVSDAPPAGAVIYDAVVNTAIGVTAQTPSNFSGNRMMGGKIEYRALATARVLRAVAHELGHVLGLGHPTGQTALMNPSPSATLQDFTSAEKLALAIYLFQRNPGTVYPDNDRNSQALGNARTTITITCGH